MTIKLIRTAEGDGNWYKIYADNVCKACIGIHDEEKDLKRAEEIFAFLVENKGGHKVVKEIEL